MVQWMEPLWWIFFSGELLWNCFLPGRGGLANWMIKMLCVASSTAFAMAFAMGGKEALSRATCGGCEKASVASASTTGKNVASPCCFCWWYSNRNLTIENTGATTLSTLHIILKICACNAMSYQRIYVVPIVLNFPPKLSKF